VVNDDALAEIGAGGTLAIGGALAADATETGKTKTLQKATHTRQDRRRRSLALTVANDAATSTTLSDVTAAVP